MQNGNRHKMANAQKERGAGGEGGAGRAWAQTVLKKSTS
jgi:hypothetical protein